MSLFPSNVLQVDIKFYQCTGKKQQEFFEVGDTKLSNQKNYVKQFDRNNQREFGKDQETKLKVRDRCLGFSF